MFHKLFVYLFLLCFAIPWYWPAEDDRLLFGMPMWVSVSVLFSTLIAAYTAYLLLKYPWPGEK